MIWANIQQLAAMGIQKQPTEESLGTKNIKNSFDKDYVSILMLMLRWLPSYMNDLRNRAYNPPPRAESSLRNIFAQAASEKIQDILIHDFLSYLALNHNIYPETWDENEKKNFFHKLQKTD